MNQKRVFFTGIASLILVSAFVTTALAANSSRYRVDLYGGAEVPPVTAGTTGRATFKISDDESSIQFRLRVDEGDQITQAHLHCAPAGQNGPVVAFLWGNVPGGFDVDGELADYTLQAGNIVPTASTCTPPITTMAQLIAAIKAGNIYANVHSVAYPNGVIRGQLTQD